MCLVTQCVTVSWLNCFCGLWTEHSQHSSGHSSSFSFSCLLETQETRNDTPPFVFWFETSRTVLHSQQEIQIGKTFTWPPTLHLDVEGSKSIHCGHKKTRLWISCEAQVNLKFSCKVAGILDVITTLIESGSGQNRLKVFQGSVR